MQSGPTARGGVGGLRGGLLGSGLLLSPTLPHKQWGCDAQHPGRPVLPDLRRYYIRHMKRFPGMEKAKHRLRRSHYCVVYVPNLYILLVLCGSIGALVLYT